MARWFARVRTFDLACPRCDKISVIRGGGSQKSREWDPRLGRWTCGSCLLTLAIGIVGYRIVEAGNASIASDQVPTVQQAVELRARYASILAERRARRKGSEEELNRLVEGEGGEDDTA